MRCEDTGKQMRSKICARAIAKVVVKKEHAMDLTSASEEGDGNSRTHISILNSHLKIAQSLAPRSDSKDKWLKAK